MRGAAAQAAFSPAPEGDAGPGAPNGTLFAPRLQKLGSSSPHARVLQLLAPVGVQGTEPQMLRPPQGDTAVLAAALHAFTPRREGIWKVSWRFFFIMCVYSNAKQGVLL